MVKEFVKLKLSHFYFFFKYLRYRVFVVLLLSLFVGFLDGLGLTMFLPLLKIADGSAEASSENLGKLSFLVDSLNTMGIRLTLLNTLLFILFFFSLKAVASFYSNYYKLVVKQFFVKKMRLKLLSYLSDFSYKLFVQADTGRVQNALSGEVGKVSGAFTSYFSSIQSFIMVLIYMFFAFLVDWKFALLITLGGILSNFLFRGIFKKTKKLSNNSTVLGNVYQRLLIQYVHNFKYLKATGTANQFVQKLKLTAVEVENNNKRMGVLGIRVSAVREPVLIAIVCAVIGVQVYVFSGSLSAVLVSLLFFYRSLSFLMTMQSNYNAFLVSSGALTNISNFEDELRRGSEKNGTQSISEFQNKIEFKNVFFKYDTSDYILTDISLSLTKNQTIAFVGESGSGKTTLINVLSGLLEPSKGDLLVDGHFISDLNVSSFQQRIGYIAQESVIFNDTVFNNVTFWDKDTPENKERFYSALEQASLKDFVDELPKKEQSLLGNNGINLSGGQRQRISIARELYKTIDILILDEATSALDSETERAIQENIDQLKGNYTIVVIAHRLSTIKNADVVYFMDKGKIVESGSFEELLLKSHRFKKMVELQEI